jgi:hypothetical protein
MAQISHKRNPGLALDLFIWGIIDQFQLYPSWLMIGLGMFGGYTTFRIKDYPLHKIIFF